MSAAPKLDFNHDNRRFARRTVVEDARIISKRGGWSLIDCLVCDLSEGGAKLQIDPHLDIPSLFDLLLVKELQIISVKIRWRRRNFIGVQFCGEPRRAPPFVFAEMLGILLGDSRFFRSLLTQGNSGTK